MRKNLKLFAIFFITFCTLHTQFSIAKKANSHYRVVGKSGKPLLDRKVPEYNKKMLATQNPSFYQQQGRQYNSPKKQDSIPDKKRLNQGIRPQKPDESGDVSETIDAPEHPQKHVFRPSSGFESLDNINFNESKNIGRAKEMVLNNQNVSPQAVPKKVFSPYQKDYYINAGTFKNQPEAISTARKLSHVLKMPIDPEFSSSKNIYKIIIGPFPNQKDASIILDSITRSGHVNAKIVEEK